VEVTLLIGVGPYLVKLLALGWLEVVVRPIPIIVWDAGEADYWLSGALS
jgi:hypothetical protein